MITLGIDYGASNIGVALVRNTRDGNEPLFAGTIVLDARALKEKTEPRAAMRRLRRTRKTKTRRLKELKTKLMSLGLDVETVSRIVHFCERRGYKSLFGGEKAVDDQSSEELTYRFTREDFFQSLQQELREIVPSSELQTRALEVCERILNRDGDPRFEVRPMRIDNRGVSRCSWEGCNKTTPRRVNATDDAIRQQLVAFFQGVLKEKTHLIDDVSRAASQLNDISHELQAAIDREGTEDQKSLRKRARTILRGLKNVLWESHDVDDRMNESWKYVEKGLINILQSGYGRNRYCREHSQEYVQTVMAGKPTPFKKSIAESDIISRREQIAFSKLWRYIEARLLPLAPKGIDRIVVERTAFDLLAGSRKQIGKASDKSIEDVYQSGPMLGFASKHDMLEKEFGGLCAYCGKPSDKLMEREHILPRSQFFFDSYLNLLPACSPCNAEKGRRRIGHTSLHISQEAYEKYDAYLREVVRKRPLHFLQTEKKGILNLMCDSNRAWEVDRYLSLIANNFASIVQSQRGPRPFARFLYSKLSTRQKKPPEIEFRSGRHTALYRNIAYPEFQKEQDKSEGGKVNHALDAMLLASQLPDPRPLEARGINVHEMGTWRRKALSRAPQAGKDGIPVMPGYNWCVPGFEIVDGNGYVEVEMGSMNWNQRDSATHKQDPYGWSEKTSKPTKRTAALELYEQLAKEKDKGKLERLVATIHHPALREDMAKALEKTSPGPAVAEAMKAWLRKSVANSIGSSSLSKHPADMRRRQDLENFAGDTNASIPRVIGVKRFDQGVQGKIDLERRDPLTGKTGHRYMTDPANRAVVLAYPCRADGKANFSKPVTAGVRQNFALKTSGERIFGPKPPELEGGRVWGNGVNQASRWNDTLETYLADCGFHSYVLLTPCCVICYEDGTKRFIRNFDESKDFKKRILKGVIGVRRTPFASKTVPLKVLTPKVEKS